VVEIGVQRVRSAGSARLSHVEVASGDVERSPSGCQLGGVDCPEVHVPGNGNCRGSPLQRCSGACWLTRRRRGHRGRRCSRRSVGRRGGRSGRRLSEYSELGVNDHVWHGGATNWSDRGGADAGGGLQYIGV